MRFSLEINGFALNFTIFILTVLTLKNQNNYNHAYVWNNFNFDRYPTCYFISETLFHPQACVGSLDFEFISKLYSNYIQFH